MAESSKLQQNRELFTRVHNSLIEILADINKEKFSSALAACVNTIAYIPPAFILFGHSYPMRFNIIVAQNNLGVLLQEDDNGSHDATIENIKRALNTLKEDLEAELPKTGGKKSPVKLKAVAELNLPQAIKLLQSYGEDYRANIPRVVESGCCVFTGPILARILNFPTDKLPLIKELVVKIMSDYWLFENVAILATARGVPGQIVRGAVADYSQQQQKSFIITSRDWGVWHLAGSNLAYSWLISNDTYTALQPNILWLGFPFQLEADPKGKKETPDEKLVRFANERINLEKNINLALKPEITTDARVVSAYKTSLADIKLLQQEFVDLTSEIAALKIQADQSTNLHERLKMRQVIEDITLIKIPLVNKRMAALKEARAKLLAQHRELLQDIQRRKNIARTKLIERMGL